MMKLAIATAACMLLSPTSSQAGSFYNYFAWENLSREARLAYVAGTLDALLSFTSNDGAKKAADHYSSCIDRNQIRLGQLSDNVLVFAREHPEFQQSLQFALVNYLIDLCGRPPV